MKLPFHGVHVCGDIVFATRGGNIHSFSTDGTHIACWTYPTEAQGQKNGQQAVEEDDNGPPAKRVKIEKSDDDEASRKPIKMEVDEPERKKKAKAKQHGHSNMARPSEWPMVIMMASTKDEHSNHLVAVTSDKSIWVFEHDGQGGLAQLSRRTMPKRPCSIVIAPDTKDILSADKFGDVYALPLLPSSAPSSTLAAPSPAASAAAAPPTRSATPDAAAAPLGPFIPQASTLTVHTARNRKALNDQLVSRTHPKALAGGTPKRAPAAFERHLLLGHVSLLTAIALGRDAAARRPYILTADRDEHIRVSRGTRAQAHVVERYCMGHEHFVNRLLVAGELLLSGGGDAEVFVWRWLEGTLVGKVDVLGRVREVVGGVERIALTGLSSWAEGAEEEGARIVVICERVPAIFLFSLRNSGDLEFSRTIDLPGNPFEVAVVDDKTLIVAVDPSHKEAGEYDVKKSLLRVEHAGGEYRVSEDFIKDAGSLEAEIVSSDDISADEFEKMLYSAETLRKIYPEDREDPEDIKDESEIKDEPEL